MSIFDEVVDRNNSNSLKYDTARYRGIPDDVLPMWVADMDFKAPQPVLDRLDEKVRHGIFGYSDSDDRYFNAIKNWYADRFSWSVKPEWLVKTPGVVFAIGIAIRALTNPGQAVMIQQPVYAPFSGMVKKNKRQLIVNQLAYHNQTYQIDLDDFEKQIIRHQVKLFVLCNPHNPVGRVWTKEELTAMGEICVRHGVYICSDEIHQDFVYAGHKHEVLAQLSEPLAQQTLTCTAPSKTFNLAGLQVSNIFISNSHIRQKFKNELRASGYGLLSVMGLIACETAYEQGQAWLDELLVYLAGTISWLNTYLSQHIPQIRMIQPEGTYLLWLDCSQLGLSAVELDQFMLSKAGLWLSAGTSFGQGGKGFQRMNIGCPRSMVQKAAQQLSEAVRSLS